MDVNHVFTHKWSRMETSVSWDGLCKDVQQFVLQKEENRKVSEDILRITNAQNILQYIHRLNDCFFASHNWNIVPHFILVDVTFWGTHCLALAKGQNLDSELKHFKKFSNTRFTVGKNGSKMVQSVMVKNGLRPWLIKIMNKCFITVLWSCRLQNVCCVCEHFGASRQRWNSNTMESVGVWIGSNWHANA